MKENDLSTTKIIKNNVKIINDKKRKL